MSFSDKILEPIEDGLDKLGMMQGDAAPLKRFLLGTAIGYALVELWKPGFAFDPKDGHEYPWRVTHKDLPKDQTTMMPWWLAASIPGLALGVLI